MGNSQRKTANHKSSLSLLSLQNANPLNSRTCSICQHNTLTCACSAFQCSINTSDFSIVPHRLVLLSIHVDIPRDHTPQRRPNHRCTYRTKRMNPVINNPLCTHWSTVSELIHAVQTTWCIFLVDTCAFFSVCLINPFAGNRIKNTSGMRLAQKRESDVLTHKNKREREREI